MKPSPLKHSEHPTPLAETSGPADSTVNLDSQKRVILRPGKVQPFYGRHPWVLAKAVDQVLGDPADGDVVDLLNAQGRFVARGLYNRNSRIRVRLYTWNAAEAMDQHFWQSRIARAGELRKTLGYLQPDGACRLVFSEADGLSGLIVDRYGSDLVVQVTSLAIASRIQEMVDVLAAEFRPRSITVRAESSMSQLEGFEFDEGVYFGALADPTVFISEHGIRYGLDLGTGQKTGFYLDQRENRKAAAQFAGGRRVLDAFCYSGGFGLCAAMLGGASEVWGIDSSHKAIALAKANAQHNGARACRFDAADCFDALAGLFGSRERFGVVVLDPPKFTRTRRNIDEALRAYHRINRLAVDLLEPGGTLVTCSCSGNVLAEDFLGMLMGVAQQTKRDIQVLEQRGASPDHPVSITCLETSYLKCFICRVV